MKIIALSGLDGSGKSTQIELLKEFLEKQGKSLYYFHAVEYSVGNKILKRKKKSPLVPLYKRGKPGSLPFVKGESERDLEKGVIKANWLQIQLRKIALLVDICRFKRLAKKIKADYIISDRYFFDSVVNINYLLGENKTLCAEKYIPKPDFAFYIDVKPETIMQRERKPDQGMEYLRAKEKLFSDKIKKWDMIVIDGEKGKEEIFADLRFNLSSG